STRKPPISWKSEIVAPGRPGCPSSGQCLVLPVRSPHVGGKHRNKYARQARDFIKSHPAEFIRIERICQALGVSARTLEYSFQDIFQAGPLEYLKCRRLNAVRSELLKADRPPMTV